MPLRSSLQRGAPPRRLRAPATLIVFLFELALLLCCAARAQAQTLVQTDVVGPEGSGIFGLRVAVLPNGNFVVTDPLFDREDAADVGAVYLYDGDTRQPISILQGDGELAQAGHPGVTVLANGNFVVASMNALEGRGAATWGSAETGFGAPVVTISAANSLVGVEPPSGSSGDRVGSGGVTALANGHYVVCSPQYLAAWRTEAGAATWGDGDGGTVGQVSGANSLVGSHMNSHVCSGGVVALPGGDYLVVSPDANVEDETGGQFQAYEGAVTWGDGASGVHGEITLANSLVGTEGDSHVTVLANGNYVVATPGWGWDNLGAATWGDGTIGITGPVSVTNSLVGSSLDDWVGNGGVMALANGNYVVISLAWDTGPDIYAAGAVTWGDGTSGTTGVVTVTNSLVGRVAGDAVGSAGVTALANGNYVVSSPNWDDGGTADAGAVTWGDGDGGTVGSVTAENSLTGASADDRAGWADGHPAVAALTNGNYAVGLPLWDNGGLADVGAVVWGDGAGGTVGPVRADGALVGDRAGDRVGTALTALSNGHYVAGSPVWDNGARVDAGAATWVRGDGPTAAVVAPANSLVGGSDADFVANGGIVALTNGSYVVNSTKWAGGRGATTWADGAAATAGVVAAANSLVDTVAGNYSDYPQVMSLDDGWYVLSRPAGRDSELGEWYWRGIAALGAGDGSLVGPVSSLNSVIAGRQSNMALALSFDAPRRRLLVGRPSDSVVTIARWNYSRMILTVVLRLEE